MVTTDAHRMLFSSQSPLGSFISVLRTHFGVPKVPAWSLVCYSLPSTLSSEHFLRWLLELSIQIQETGISVLTLLKGMERIYHSLSLPWSPTFHSLSSMPKGPQNLDFQFPSLWDRASEALNFKSPCQIPPLKPHHAFRLTWSMLADNRSTHLAGSGPLTSLHGAESRRHPDLTSRSWKLSVWFEQTSLSQEPHLLHTWAGSESSVSCC